MKIRAVRVKNYKSYRDTGWIAIDPVTTLVVGKNDAGKSAFLECLGLLPVSHPHLSSKAKPRFFTPSNPVSTVAVKVSVTATELRDYLLAFQGAFHVPHRHKRESGPEEALNHFSQYIRVGEFEFEMEFEGSNGPVIRKMSLFHGFADAPTMESPIECWKISHNQDRSDFFVHGTQTANLATWNGVLQNLIRPRIYRFSAERLKVGEIAAQAAPSLDANASNLPNVLHDLRAENPGRYQRYESLVRSIFPHVQSITVRRKPGAPNVNEIAISKEPAASERTDLFIPLSESGTGISQVMAILCAAVNVERAQILIIDEPNSFLHPGAARRLVEIIKELGAHQLILSSHSSEVIAASLPATALRVSFDSQELESRVTVENADDKEVREELLRHLGISARDVFSAEKIVWVEGESDVQVFRRILATLPRSVTAGLEVISVASPGDFTRKRTDRERIFRIYDKVASGAGLFPPAAAFLFDRESRSQEDVASMSQASRERVRFLPRRMLENYLLDVSAFAALVTHLTGRPVEEVNVQRELGACVADQTLYAPGKADPARWVEVIHGAHVADRVLQSLAQTRYDKTRHGVWLIDWLLTNKRSAVSDLCDLVTSLATPSP